MTYDIMNRLKTVASDTYGYDPSNKRIWKNDEYTFYGGGGERIGRYSATKLVDDTGTHVFVFQKVQVDEYFGGRRLTTQDRLGSVGSYYPYGEAKSGTVSNADSFATYYRDSTGLDYADQRYYIGGAGRFATSDPFQASAGLAEPGSWNRYAYVESDPINRYDPEGLFWQWPSGGSVFNPVALFQALGWFFGGGGNSGGSFLPTLQPNPAWQTSTQVRAHVAVWDAAIAAALAANRARGAEEPGFRFVAYLKVVMDCYVPNNGKGSAVRRRQYQVIDNFGNPYGSAGLTINEQNYVQTGVLTSYGSTFTPNSNGIFEDELSRGTGSPDLVMFQTFTASNSSGLNSFANQAVMVLDAANPNGPFFGTLGIAARRDEVSINGSDGRVAGRLPMCTNRPL